LVQPPLPEHSLYRRRPNRKFAVKAKVCARPPGAVFGDDCVSGGSGDEHDCEALRVGIFVDKPAVTKSQLTEIPIVPIIREYEISSLPAIPNAYYPDAIESEYVLPATAISSDAKAKLPLSKILIWSWIIVSTILVARLFLTFIFGLRMLRRAFPLHCDKFEKALLIAKGKLGINKPVEVLAGSTVSSPVIWCWSRRPALLVSEDAEQFEDGIDWVGMFCHELAHWSRLDHISGLFSELMVCVFPWHPLMWLARRRLADLSEQACDDWVVAGSRCPADYAESLLDLSPQGQLFFLPAVVGRKNGLENRIRRIIKDKCGKPNLGLCWAVVVTLIAACITIGAAFAQTRPADIDEVKEKCEKLLTEEHKNELLAQEQELLVQQRELDLLNQQQELGAEQKQLEQLVNQLQLEKTKLRKKTESAVQLRLEQLKHLNSLAHQQAEYQKQADIIESEIQLTAKAKQHHGEGVPGHIPDKHEHETKQLQAQELLVELRALRAKINNIENLLQATISELYGQTTQRSQFEQITRSKSIQRQKLIDHRSELEERKSQLKRHLEIAPEGKDAKKIRLELELIEVEILDINDRLNTISQQQRLQSEEEYEAKRKELLPKRRELEERAKHIQWQLKVAPDREDAAQLKAELDEIDKEIRDIDFELSSPEWCAEKRKAEQLAAKQQYDSNLARAKAEWLTELRAFEADVVTAKQKIIEAKNTIENDRAMLEKMEQDIEIFTNENRTNLETDIVLYNKLRTMKLNRDRLAEKIERDKRVLIKYQEELKAAVERRDIYLKYKPPADTELDWLIAQPKAKEAVKEDKWHTKPPSQKGQPRSLLQKDEKLQNRINQLQDEISRLRREMAEMRKLMKDMVEYEKNRPKPSLYNIDKDPMDFEKNQRKKSLPEIYRYPLEPENKQPAKSLPEIHVEPSWPENTEPRSSKKKSSEHPHDISTELETIDSKTPSF